MRLSTWDERRGLASSAIASPSRPLVLQTWWGGGILERPYSALELQHQQAVVLAGRPDRSALGIQVDLRRAPVRTTGDKIVPEWMIGPAAYRRCTGRIEVGNFLRPTRIADVKHTNTRVEHATRQGCCVVAVIDTAVMGAVCEDR